MPSCRYCFRPLSEYRKGMLSGNGRVVVLKYYTCPLCGKTTRIEEMLYEEEE